MDKFRVSAKTVEEAITQPSLWVVHLTEFPTM